VLRIATGFLIWVLCSSLQTLQTLTHLGFDLVAAMVTGTQLLVLCVSEALQHASMVALNQSTSDQAKPLVQLNDVSLMLTPALSVCNNTCILILLVLPLLFPKCLM
jgi:hypothetical protein